MSAHTCTTLTPGCFRCELHRDEVQAYVDSLRVTLHGKVHDPDCHHVDKPSVMSASWSGGDRLPSDTACRVCLPDGIPAVTS